ncbi:MAG TPA: hypothetical protein VGL82_22305 [Bryobacteraceae bacterium]|jgi:hypothetical protein
MYSPIFNPMPFGPVTVPIPGTPVEITARLIASGVCLSGDPVEVNKISVISLPANTGAVYIGIAGMNKSTMHGVLFVFSGGNVGWQITNNEAVNTYRFDQMYVDADVAGEGVYGGVDQV